MKAQPVVYRKLSEHDAYHTLRHVIHVSESEAYDLMWRAEDHGQFEMPCGGSIVSIRYHAKSGKYTITNTETLPQFYVFRLVSKDAVSPGVMPVWAEYFADGVHMVFPLPVQHKKAAVGILEDLFPGAFVNMLCDSSDIREARTYARLIPGLQIPEGFPWEEYEDDDAIDIADYRNLMYADVLKIKS